jgi:hypothetical protein
LAKRQNIRYFQRAYKPPSYFAPVSDKFLGLDFCPPQVQRAIGDAYQNPIPMPKSIELVILLYTKPTALSSSKIRRSGSSLS